MRAIKESGAKVRRQEFDERYNIEVAVRLGEANTLKNRLEKYPIATVEQKGYE
jgi:hypothetical protein